MEDNLNKKILSVISENQSFSYDEVAKFINKEIGTDLTAESIRNRVRRIALKNNQTTDEFKKNLFSNTLEENNFKPHNWTNGWLKVDGASIHIKNKESIVTYDQIRDEFISDIKKIAPKYPKLKRDKIIDGHLFVFDPADIHVGKFASLEETGNSYDVNKAVSQVLEACDEMLLKAKYFNVDKILFVIGNDVLHVDNKRSSTTKGTPQDTDGDWYTAYKSAKNMYIKVIEYLVQVADVHIVHNPSNHDETHGTLLADSISSYFTHNKNVTCDVGTADRKYFLYGNTLVGTTHGDGAKAHDLPLIMAQEVPKHWADSYFRYVFQHHVHHYSKTKFNSGKDYIGVTVESLRSPSATDSWHAKNGYLSNKAIEGFVISKENGMVAKLTHYFK